ncbi:MAG: molybdate ABC transporter substrate-binding protein [Bacteroidota bacterium]
MGVKRFFGLVLLLFFGIGSTVGQSQTLRIAAAANTRFVMKQLQEDFKKRTGIAIEVITGASGNLTAQIKNGAPYDLFFSADMDFPAELYKTGFALNAPKIYALGSLIVCSRSRTDIKNWRRLLPLPAVNKIAIANPALAPYGKAAEDALKYYKLWEQVQPKLVLGESISQVNTYVVTGSVALAFTTEALIQELKAQQGNTEFRQLYWTKVDPAVYQKIEQGMVVLSHAKKENYAAAMKFFNYVSSASAGQILKQSGYRLP